MMLLLLQTGGEADGLFIPLVTEVQLGRLNR